MIRRNIINYLNSSQQKNNSLQSNPGGGASFNVPCDTPTHTSTLFMPCQNNYRCAFFFSFSSNDELQNNKTRKTNRPDMVEYYKAMKFPTLLRQMPKHLVNYYFFDKFLFKFLIFHELKFSKMNTEKLLKVFTNLLLWNSAFRALPVPCDESTRTNK